uniref:Saposin B-type domain-containing protein n=1 Tax=Heterorhabditis bacteriophora TaxID=37862 RepID=A0A1I7WES3_HETBA
MRYERFPSNTPAKIHVHHCQQTSSYHNLLQTLRLTIDIQCEILYRLIETLFNCNYCNGPLLLCNRVIQPIACFEVAAHALRAYKPSLCNRD